MQTPTSFSLPYCPNCRTPLQASKVGWICWNTIAKNVRIPTAGSAQQDADDVFSSAPQADQRHANHEADLCEEYNPAGVTICNKCKKQKDRFLMGCPSCFEELQDIRNVNPKSIVITGPSNAGKTHYIVALYQWWVANLDTYDLKIRDSMGFKTLKEFKRRLANVMGQKKLEANITGEMLSFSWVIRPTSDPTRLGILCSLPDISGERLTDPRYLAANHHYDFTAGIILILDGDRIAVAQKLMRADDKRPAQDNFAVVDAMVRDFELRFGTKFDEEMKKIPIAICINKVDNLQTRHPGWDSIMVDYVPEHNGGLDISTVDERSKRIEELLAEKPGTKPLLSLLRSFPVKMFFAMAAIGNEPEGDHLTFEPLSVEDPFLWLIWKLQMFNN